MSKLPPVEPVLENPELAVPVIVTVKAVETARNIDTLHDAYGRLVGAYQPAPVVDPSTLNPTSSGGTFIASRPRRGPDGKIIVGVQAPPVYQPPSSSPSSGTYIISRNPTQPQPPPLPLDITHNDPLDDNSSTGEDPVNLPFDDEDDLGGGPFFDVPLEETLGGAGGALPTGLRRRGGSSGSRAPQRDMERGEEVVATDADAEGEEPEGGGVSLLPVEVVTSCSSYWWDCRCWYFSTS